MINNRISNINKLMDGRQPEEFLIELEEELRLLNSDLEKLLKDMNKNE